PPGPVPKALTVRTDEKGFYSLRLPPGRYKARVSSVGFVPASELIGVPPGTKLDHDFSLRPAPARVVMLRVVWGHLRYNPEGSFKAWDGFLSVTSGRIRVVEAIRFDKGGDYKNGGDDRLYERSAPNVVSWRSSTTVHNDGILVELVVPPTDGPVWVTLHTASWSATVEIQRVVGLHTVIDVDDEGRQLRIDCEPVRPCECPGPLPVEPPAPPIEPERPPAEPPEEPHANTTDPSGTNIQPE
ncbi:MAG: carboxypeptidase-like regulatory domain-containing protein, partial [Thermoplasmatota archaeon]